MKGIEILVLKAFGVVYVKFMVRKWYGILVIHRQKKVKIYLCNQEHRF